MEILVQLHSDDVDRLKSAVIDASGRCTVSQLKILAREDRSISIHDLLRRANIVLPSPVVTTPVRSPELEARIRDLRRTQVSRCFPQSIGLDYIVNGNIYQIVS